MKKLLTILIFGLLLVACGYTDDSEDDTDTVQELSLQQTVSGTISEPGEVDWYHYRVVQANAVLQVKCTSNTYRPEVTLLATIYTLNESGEKVRLYADHAPENSQLPADVEMDVYINVPKDIYISVRDLMDDDSSENPYYLTIDFAQGGDENGDFSQATPIGVDDGDHCVTDTIGYIGDVDCLWFTAADTGVYDVQVVFSPFAGGTDVALSIELYDSEGNQVATLSQTQRLAYHIISNLEAGDYYILVDDHGKDDFDEASSYTVCVSTVATTEAGENDSRVDASVMAYDTATQTFTAEGSLDYLGDRDWYHLPLDDIDTTGFKILQVEFDDLNPMIQFGYQLDLDDQDQIIQLSHTFSGGAAAYVTQVKAGTGDHFLCVKPVATQNVIQNAPYRVSIKVLDIDDPAEIVVSTDPESGQTLVGNNTIDTAVMLVPASEPTAATAAKISFRGDVDWYYIVIPDPATPGIIELYLDTDEQPSLVEYCVSFIRDGVIKKMFDSNGHNGGTELKGSIYVPAFQVSDQLAYYFKVSDYQGDDGDGTVSYHIRANYLDIPATIPLDSTIPAAEKTYVNEVEEQESPTAETIHVEVDALIQKAFPANTALLKFNNDTPAEGVTIVVSPDQTRTISFPWIAGYIDYQGDQDFYAIDLGPWMQGGVALDTNWYYDIQVELLTDSPGSDVEYVWKFFRDMNSNRILVDRPQDSNGFFASAGDEDTHLQSLDIITPEEGGETSFWVGDEWEGRFYLSVSDFDYVASESPDDDWGYAGQPYHIRVTLTYHPGQSHP